MKKIILLTAGSLTNEDYQNLEISNYRKHSIKFEIWNFNFLYKLYNKKIRKKNCEIFLSSFKHFKKLIIKNKKNSLLFDVRTNFNLASIRVFYYLTRYDCKFILHVGNIETNLSQNKKKFVFIDKIKSLFSRKFFLYVKSKIEIIFFKLNFHKFYILKYADFVYVMGKKTFHNLKINPIIGSDTKIIKGHHRNHDQYLILKKKKILEKTNEKFVLFIDQGVPVHPDLIKLNLNDVNIEEYYNSLRIFFLKIEKKFNIKVKIAAHPKINVKKISKYLKEFQIIQGKTLELIFKSKFIITHDSTVTNFAIFLKKPILIIINNSLLNSKHNHLREAKNLAQHLKKKVVNIDKLNLKILQKQLFVNDIIYMKYTLNYYKFAKSNLSYSNKLIKVLKEKSKKIF
jgi:hypothetical protein